MGRFIVVALLSASALSASAADSGAMVCRPTQKFSCDLGKGCTSIDAKGVWSIINQAQARYERCDAKGCDRYAAVFTTNGAFTSVELPGRATFAKIGFDGSFVEAATLGTALFVSHGHCKTED